MNRSGLEWLLSQEHAKLKKILSQFLGYYLLLLSDEGYPYDLTCPISTHILVQQKDERSGPDEGVIANWLELPFAADSVDAIVLPHGVDYYEDIQSLLKQLCLILRHDGHLVLSGFNPMRLKARKLAKCYHDSSLRLRLCLIIQRELEHAGFEVDQVCHYGFFGIKNKFMAKWVNRLFNKIFPSLGCAYVIVAKKKVFAPITVEPNWNNPILKPDQVVISSCRVNQNDG